MSIYAYHTHSKHNIPDALLVDVRLEEPRVTVKLHQIVNLPLDHKVLLDVYKQMMMITRMRMMMIVMMMVLMMIALFFTFFNAGPFFSLPAASVCVTTMLLLFQKKNLRNVNNYNNNKKKFKSGKVCAWRLLISHVCLLMRKSHLLEYMVITVSSKDTLALNTSYLKIYLHLQKVAYKRSYIYI